MSDQISFSALGLFFLIIAVNVEAEGWVRLVGIALAVTLIGVGSRLGRKAEHEAVMRRGSSVAR